MTVEVMTFDQVMPRERGLAHGESCRESIHELATIRTELMLRRGRLGSVDHVRRAAGMHLPVLQRWNADLYQELMGIADGAALAPELVVVLNHYTDLRDLSPDVLVSADDAGGRERGDGGEGCTAIYVPSQVSHLLGQTWDMHASACPYVRILRIRPRDSERELLCFTLTGCLGMAGMASSGVAVTINNLTTTDAKVGVLWPALVRCMLEQPDANAARDVLMRAPLSSGHNYMIADGRQFFGIETSGSLKVLTQMGERAAHIHTNHCFDPVLRKRECIVPNSTTFERMNEATTSYVQQRPTTAEALWALLGSHTGYPRSICSHLDEDNDDPSASKTCGALVMELGTGRMLTTRGCLQASPPTELFVQCWHAAASESP